MLCLLPWATLSLYKVGVLAFERDSVKSQLCTTVDKKKNITFFQRKVLIPKLLILI